MANLIDGLQEEMNRCRELLKVYEAIPAGAFGALMIRQIILKAEKSISSGDVIEMLRALQELKECK